MDQPLSFIGKSNNISKVTTPVKSVAFKTHLNKTEELKIPILETIDIQKMSPLKIKTPIRVSPPAVKLKVNPPKYHEELEEDEEFEDDEDEEEIRERANDLINDPTKIDYSIEQEPVKKLCTEIFKSKFENLKLNYPDRNITFPEGKSLNKIHDSYHNIIKAIYVNMNLGQIQLGYIIVLMAVEFTSVKAFNIPLAGFTKMELKRMHRYNQMMVEIGESLYSTGGTPWPIEWRILGTLVMNVVIFIALKCLAQYVGGESMTEVIRNAVDKVLDNPVTKDNIETGVKTKDTTSDGLGSMMEGMLGGDGGGIADLITSLGTGFTQKMEKTKKKVATKRKFIFED